MIRFWFSKEALTGGNIYNRMAMDVLRARGVEIREELGYTSYRGKGFSYVNGMYLHCCKSSGLHDIDIMDYGTSTWSSRRFKGRRIITLFHYDPDEQGKAWRYRFFFKRFLRAAKNAKIVVISRHWKRYLEEQGIANLALIPCAFDTSRYQASCQREELLQRFGLPDLPIVYLGKNSRPKTLSAYRSLQHLSGECLLVTSGPTREFSGPVHLSLDFPDYVSLLHHACVTVVMPDFAEGWSRIAHESVLCGTPVLGNGRGGMGELLETLNQTRITPSDSATLVAAVRSAIANAGRVPEPDRQRAGDYDLKAFGDRWLDVVCEVAEGLPAGAKGKTR